MIANVLIVWFTLSVIGVVAFSAVRTWQKRRDREEYELAMARYRPCINGECRRVGGR
jgi:hypothetical protein